MICQHVKHRKKHQMMGFHQLVPFRNMPSKWIVLRFNQPCPTSIPFGWPSNVKAHGLLVSLVLRTMSLAVAHWAFNYLDYTQVFRHSSQHLPIILLCLTNQLFRSSNHCSGTPKDLLAWHPDTTNPYPPRFAWQPRVDVDFHAFGLKIFKWCNQDETPEQSSTLKNPGLKIAHQKTASPTHSQITNHTECWGISWFRARS